jgi:hypothetical protein
MAKQNFNKTFRATRAQTRRATNSGKKARDDENSGGKKRRDGEYSYNHTKDSSTVTFSDITIPVLTVTHCISWLAEVTQILEANNLNDWVENSKTITRKGSLSTNTIDIETNKLNFKLNVEQNKRRKEDQVESALVYNLISNAIPKVYRKLWTTKLIKPKEVWEKIKEMCHFKEDFHINVYHRNRLHDLSLHG